jgi:peptidoglycan/LPS O-acetylase OafA/YrhL/lysophospholipase L1-like esterase
MPEPVRAGQRYMPGLDGLRALAVLAVIAFHEQLGWAPGGLLGVGVFFTLSGYLITDLLLGQWATRGRLALADFWARRARRLLPALFVMLAVVTAWITLADRARLAGLRGSVVAAATYSSNWYLIVQGQSYFARFAPPAPLDHLWSLAVEEQFYLAWPWLLLAGLICLRRLRHGRPGGVAWLALPTLAMAACSAWAMVALYHPGLDPTRVYEGTDTRASGLLIGAALAMAWPSRRAAARHLAAVPGDAVGRGAARRGGASADRATRVALDAAAFAGLGVIFVMIWRTGQYSPFLYRGGLILLSAASAAVIAAAARPGTLTGKVLGCGPLRWLGVRSYGVYLWHYPVIVLFTPANATEDLARAAWQTVVTIALAALSWHYIEEPIRRGALARLWKQLPVATLRPAGAHSGAAAARTAAATASTATASFAAAAAPATASTATAATATAATATASTATATPATATPATAATATAAPATASTATASTATGPATAASTATRPAARAVGALAGAAASTMAALAAAARPGSRPIRAARRSAAAAWPGRARLLGAAPAALATVAAVAVLSTACVGLSGAVSAPPSASATSLARSSLPAPSRGQAAAPIDGGQAADRISPAISPAAGPTPSSSAASTLRTSCRAVAHLGDSTSEGMVSPDYLPNPGQRLVAQYQDVGVQQVVTNIVGANSIVETLPGDINDYNAARNIVSQGFRGCWVIALGTNDTADVAIGSSVGRMARIQEMMSVAHGEPVMWVDVISQLTSGPYAEANMQLWNAALRQACARYPNMRVFDWASLAQPSWFISDGIHYTPAGYAQRAEQIAEALAKAFPAKGHSKGCVVS